MSRLGWLGILWLVLAAGAASSRSAERTPLFFSCPADNDLYRVVSANPAWAPVRWESPREAVAQAPEGAGVLLLADGYPEKPTALAPAVFEQAARKKLRLYVEYPAALPGLAVGKPAGTRFERAVVTSDFFGPALGPLRLLGINGLQYVTLPATLTNADLVAARVAGFDTAVYGLPKTTHPLLFQPGDSNLLVGTTALSRFVTGRYSPTDDWRTVWERILSWLAPEARAVELKWTPMVRPSFTREEPLPGDAEKEALRRGVDWFVRSKLLLHPSRLDAVDRAAKGDGLLPTPAPDAPNGDGSLGILEAPLSIIRSDGSQLQSVARRGDCTAESAMALAFGGRCFDEGDKSTIARNLIDFYYFTSEARKRERADPNHSAYGLIAWGVGSPAWYVANYGDDNARLLLGTMAAAALLGEDRWDEAMMMCLLGNVRTTGRQGFRSDRLDIGPLGQHPWTYFYQRNVVNLAPHFEAYLWACYLWAYQKTGDEVFLTRTLKALRASMRAYPKGFRWTNGLAQERARLLLPLAWLVRVADTPEHRAWLREAVEGLLALQDASGGIREELGPTGQGIMPPPRSNEEYGLNEASLIQRNGDPVSDMLYTVNFAFLGLHEAVAATKDPAWSAAADKLAQFLVRIQIRSETRPELDGGWFRAFDLRRWEAWASNADAGWGAWAIESGWTQGWITSVLGLRQMKTSLWDLTAGSRAGRHFARLRAQMMPADALTEPPGAFARHAAVGKNATLRTPYSNSYPGEGETSLTDGLLAQTNHSDAAWLGFHGDDLVALIDLGEAVALKDLGGSFLQDVGLGIFLPRRVEFLIGDDPAALQLAGRAMPAANEKQPGPFKEVLTIQNVNRRARYLEVRAANAGTIPAWHHAAGQKAWLFVDEIIVNPNQLDAATAPPKPEISLTLIPPSPVTEPITLDIRAAVWNDGEVAKTFTMAFYLDEEKAGQPLHRETLEVAPKAPAGAKFRWPAQGHAGKHRVIVVAQAGEKILRFERAIEIIASDARSTRRLGGAWVDLYHHDPAEGKPFDADLGQMTDTDWRDLVRAMHATDQNLLVITMMFQNFTHRGRHKIPTEGYPGKAYYPSRLFPGRMPIASPDPLEAILAEADRLGMHVMPGVGIYAFFDYTPDSLAWHKKVAAELWERYGHHPSFYGWYVSEEKDGSLGGAEERREIAEFFREFTAYTRRLAPDKPVMLAPNCFHTRGAEPAYRQLLPHLDILCPFGFHRMPEGDRGGEETAALAQSLCDEAGCHLWMDLESFVFRNGIELHPRPISGLVSDFTRFANFEKTLHYQFPGLMSAPWMSRRPGGEAAVKLYKDYQQFLQNPQPRNDR